MICITHATRTKKRAKIQRKEASATRTITFPAHRRVDFEEKKDDILVFYDNHNVQSLEFAIH